MVNIVHLSDPHLTADSIGNLPNMLDRISALRDVDLVVVSGDCSHDGSVASYRMLRDAVDEFASARGAKAVFAVGNHDERDAFASVFHNCGLPNPLCANGVTGIGDVAGYQVVVLDSLVVGRAYGQLGDEQRAALSDVVNRPTVVVLHHPPLAAATDLLCTIGLADAAELGEILAGSPVRLVLSGHYHYPASGLFAGVPVLVAPGIADMSYIGIDRSVHRTVTGSGLQVIELSDDGFTAMPILLGGGDVISECGGADVAELADRIGYPDWRFRR